MSGCKKYKFRRQFIDDVPDNAYGIYVIWFVNKNNKRWCVYVGQAKYQEIKKRLHQHWNESHNEGLRQWIAAEGHNLQFCFICCASKEIIDSYEKSLITKLQPITNIQGRRV